MEESRLIRARARDNCSATASPVIPFGIEEMMLSFGRNYVPRLVSTLRTPAMLIDVEKLQNNCKKMQDRCKHMNVALRPHMKAVKTREVGCFMTNGSRQRIVVSNMAEAKFYADGGFDDILLAAPITQNKLESARELMSQLDAFHVTTDNMTVLNAIARTPPADGKRWSVVLKLNVGSARCGVEPSDPAALQLARAINDSTNIKFAGVYAYCGHCYDYSRPDEISKAAARVKNKTTAFAKRLESENIECPIVGVFTTPACTFATCDMTGVTEVHPGSFAFNEFDVVRTGACSEEDIAVSVLTTVVGHYPKTGHMIIDAGWTAISVHKGDDDVGFGRFIGAPELRVTKIYQEVAKVESISGHLNFQKYPIGSTIRLLPFMSYAVAVLHPVHYAVNGDLVVDEWMPVKGW
ncbi:D-serine dehydratase-like [Corticium candelabrum]|uniref:D-serine dehydratase-like n=1 Tax=Corticium candelabrum TaxID=121492 RepID=UPI002E2592BF|nr:D-serine dehydratase-like [Corticium candelabrum]